MADILLRNLECNLKEKLRQSAAKNKRLMNAELREIVRVALTQVKQSNSAQAMD